ncbi:type II toxin-antitoxin system Phd/YefM family antitoxin [Candidatus Bipolaricaulota bacterium]|nr:type II toxin-antitoxin system Phd/YefM family antitoxin [Candidatus Bipolaricaulota bacterium]
MTVKIARDQMRSSSEVRRHLGEYLDEARECDLYILRRGKPAAVIVHIDRYEALLEQLGELQELEEHLAIYKMIKEREGQIEAEEFVSLDELH